MQHQAVGIAADSLLVRCLLAKSKKCFLPHSRSNDNLQVQPIIICNVFSPSSPIQEFKFMGQCRSPSVSPSRQAASSTGPAPEQLSLFQQYLQEGNPFEMPAEHREEETEDVLASNGVGDKKQFLLVLVWDVQVCVTQSLRQLQKQAQRDSCWFTGVHHLQCNVMWTVYTSRHHTQVLLVNTATCYLLSIVHYQTNNKCSLCVDHTTGWILT